MDFGQSLDIEQIKRLSFEVICVNAYITVNVKFNSEQLLFLVEKTH